MLTAVVAAAAAAAYQIYSTKTKYINTVIPSRVVMTELYLSVIKNSKLIY